MTGVPVSMTVDASLPLTSMDIIIKPLTSSEPDDLTEISFREDVSGLGDTGAQLGLI